MSPLGSPICNRYTHTWLGDRWRRRATGWGGRERQKIEVQEAVISRS